MNVAWGGQCGYHHVALNLSLNHKTTENLKHTKDNLYYCLIYSNWNNFKSSSIICVRYNSRIKFFLYKSSIR